MSHIAIDARVINSGTGTYVVKLLEYLQKIDHHNTYSILVPTKDKDYWQPTNSNFNVLTIDFKNYSLAEQLGFKTFLDDLSPDLVHFCMPQQPIRYRGKHVTTVHDMTLLNTYNSDKNWLVFHAKQLVGRWVFKKIAQTSQHIITVSNTTKREYQAFCGIADDKITTIMKLPRFIGAAYSRTKHRLRVLLLMSASSLITKIFAVWATPTKNYYKSTPTSD